ncbi:hypothetical protein N7488_000651 [Penicillium malachiteum]|nr:hypothetical protein N7488_000651 [Penicillium malachiteum]
MDLDDTETRCERLAAQAHRFAAFTGIHESNEGDRFFLLFGSPGSGKSSFIARCTETTVGPADGLPSSTNSIGVYEYKLHGRRIYLIDTPGFCHPDRSDVDTIKTLATYLGASYANGRRIQGVLLLHSITAGRGMTATDIRNIRMVMTICGFQSCRNIGIVTTNWPSETNNTQLNMIKAWNQNAFISNNETYILSRYYDHIIRDGAFTARYNESGTLNPYEQKASARSIVLRLINISSLPNFEPEVLHLRRSYWMIIVLLVKLPLALLLVSSLLSQIMHFKQSQALNPEIEMFTDGGQNDKVEELLAVKDKPTKFFKENERRREVLKKTLAELCEEETRAWAEKIDILDNDFLVELEEKRTEFHDLEDTLLQLREDIEDESTHSLDSNEEAEIGLEEYKEVIDDCRHNLERSEIYFDGFRENREEIVERVNLRLGHDDALACSLM